MTEQHYQLETPRGTIRGHFRPPGAVSDRFAVILPGWIGYSAGPHRLLYELAEAVAAEGWGTVRFDYIGRGDSDGAPGETSFDSAVDDLRAVVADIQRRFGPERLDAIGLCFGATVALRCLDVWGRMVLLSPVMTDGRSRASTAVRAVRRGGGRIVRKALSPRAWWGVLRGRGDLTGAIHYYTQSNPMPFTARMPPQELRGATRAALLFGGADARGEVAARHYAACCESRGLAHTTHVVPGADHSFCSIPAKDAVIALTRRALLGEEAR